MSTFWAGRRVFVTGHTGFKGSWLSLWLTGMGAEVHGFSLEPPTAPNLFTVARVAPLLASHVIGDIRDGDAVRAAMQAAQPDIVLHLAAQPLVRLSYDEPVATYATNVMGTLHVLEAARACGSVTALVNVTTDKCYDNKEWAWGYRETEALGGHDPYSSSKACSEILTSAYRASYHGSGAPWIGSGRAGNVIGGGDWALDRILPDTFRALDAGKTLTIRHPGAIRPWQHVLEPLAGYIALAERLATDGAPFATAWNFGPSDDDAQPVGWILDTVRTLCPALRWEVEDRPAVHEAHFLKLDSSKARSGLGWRPRWPLATALGKTVDWHRAWAEGQDMQAFSRQQIAAYETAHG